MKTTENEASTTKMELIHIFANLAAGTGRRMNAAVRGHEMVMDVRKDWGGEDAGPTPPEYLVIGLGGCILNICRIMAMEKQIALQDLRLLIDGDIDPSRAFGLDTTARAGFYIWLCGWSFPRNFRRARKKTSDANSLPGARCATPSAIRLL